MFLKKELEDTKKLAELKIQEILNDDDKYSDFQYIQNLQTLIKLKDASEKCEGF